MSKVGNFNRYARIRREREALTANQVQQLLQARCRYVVGFPAYLVSPDGVLYSTHGRRVQQIRPGVKPNGYEFVGLRGAGGCKYRMVHRIVAEAFIPNPRGLPTVNHKDGNKLNNAVENLEWCTYSENSLHGVETGLVPRGHERVDAKLTAEQVREIRVATGKYRDIGARYGVCAQAVLNVKHRRTYRNVE